MKQIVIFSIILMSISGSLLAQKSILYSYHIDYFHSNDSLGYRIFGNVVDPIEIPSSSRLDIGLSGIKTINSYFRSDTIFVDLIWNNCGDINSTMLLGFFDFDTSSSVNMVLPDRPLITRLMLANEDCDTAAGKPHLNGVVDTIIYGTANTHFAANEAGNNAKAKVYPNPNYGLLNIEGVQSISLIRLLQLDGKEVFKQVERDLNVNTRSIDISSVPTGIYILELVQVNGLITHSLITKQ